jgi:DNA-binding NarL/FixJ family response regulator
VIRVLATAVSAVGRAAVAALGAERPTLRVIACATGPDLVRQLEDARPDVVLLDLPRRRLRDALRALARRPRPPGLIVLGDDVRAVLAADLPAGVGRAALRRDARAGELGAAVEAVAAGLVVLHPDLLPPMPRLRAAAARGEPDQPLTPREVEVLAMMAEGLGNKTIAARLGISGHTAKFHVASILGKLGAGSRTEAVTIGLREGVIMI